MRTDPGGDAQPNAPGQLRQAKLLLWLAIRLVHLGQGAISVGVGWSAYREPRVALAVLVVAVAESATIARLDLRRGRLLPGLAMLDTILSAAALVAVGFAMPMRDRTTSLDWMLPYAVGAVVGLALCERAWRGIVASLALALTYVGSTLADARHGAGSRATVVANAASFPGFFTIVALVSHFADHMADALDHARQAAIESGERLAVLRERRRSQRLIHDSALQTLEAIASGRFVEEHAMRAQARLEATRLRAELTGATSEGALALRVAEVIYEVEAANGLRVELVGTPGLLEPPYAVGDALLAATREALVNVAKHAGVVHAVVRVRSQGEGVEIVVRDEGRGFDTASADGGFGIEHSITGRMADVGGVARVSSEPGFGTRVQLWGPGS